MNEESIYYMLINIVFKVIKKARLDRDLSSRDVKMSIQTENVKWWLKLSYGVKSFFFIIINVGVRTNLRTP
jgi:hypothetical protein